MTTTQDGVTISSATIRRIGLALGALLALVLIVAAATHHLLGGVDLIVLGGWSLATWLTERLSNEVAAHTRQTNQKITDRFTRLPHDQIERLCRWLDAHAPAFRALDQLEAAPGEARDRAGS